MEKKEENEEEDGHAYDFDYVVAVMDAGVVTNKHMMLLQLQQMVMPCDAVLPMSVWSHQSLRQHTVSVGAEGSY